MKRTALAITTLSALLALSACSTDPLVAPKTAANERRLNPPAETRAERDARSAIQTLRGPDGKRATLRLRRFIKDFPRSRVVDDAYMALAQRDFDAQNYAAAYAGFNTVSQNSPRASEATLRSARCLVIMNKSEDALRVLERRSGTTDTPEQALEAQRIRYEAAIQTKRNMDAVAALVYLAQRALVEAERTRHRQAVTELVETKLSEDETRKVAEGSEFGFAQANGKLRIASLLLEQRQIDRARTELTECLAIAKQDSINSNDVSVRAQRLLDQLDTRTKVESRTVGVVLPLTGKQSATGLKTLHGIQLGLGVIGKVPSGLRLAVVDSEGNPDVARKAVERLIVEDGAIAIVGGLLSKTASAEAAKAQELGAPAIMLSQKAGVTQAGDSIFRNAVTSQMQVQRIVEIAMGDLHLSRFAILFPNDAYGSEYANIFWDEVKSRGGSIVGAQPYDPKATDFRPYMQRLAGVYYLEDRYEEYRVALKKWQQKNPKRAVRNSAPTFEDMVGPAADFDAIFVPDRIDALRLIAPTLPLYELNDVRLLGTNLWNRPELVERKSREFEGALFVDSFAADDPVALNSDFFANYRAVFPGEEPGIFELQAYDTGLILRRILSGGESSRSGVARRLAELKNFPGALGPLSASSDREIRRPMVGLTVQDGKIAPFDETSKRR